MILDDVVMPCPNFRLVSLYPILKLEAVDLFF